MQALIFHTKDQAASDTVEHDVLPHMGQIAGMAERLHWISCAVFEVTRKQTAAIEEKVGSESAVLEGVQGRI